MNKIQALFLRARHWQIFLLLFAVPSIAQMIEIEILWQRHLEEMEPLEHVLPFPPLYVAIMLFFMLCFLGWLGSLGTFLNSMTSPLLRLRIRFFLISLIYPPVYVCTLLAFLRIFGRERLISIIPFIIPFHLFTVFCILYVLYFVARNLVLAETSKPASFYDYCGPFFLIWFFPIGIWIIQPRINRMYALKARHDEKPQQSNLSQDDIVNRIPPLVNSYYVTYVRELGPAVKGKLITDTEAGRSGFLLHFDDGTWILCYVNDSRLLWQTGSHRPEADVHALLHSDNVTDGTAPLDIDVPYASERCNIASEIAKAKGQRVSGLSIGERTFNLRFPDSMELDTSIRELPDRRLVFRVFWEQW